MIGGGEAQHPSFTDHLTYLYSILCTLSQIILQDSLSLHDLRELRNFELIQSAVDKLHDSDGRLQRIYNTN